MDREAFIRIVGPARLAAVALVVCAGSVPLAAQATSGECASLTGADKVTCLQRILAETQQALAEAERALTDDAGKGDIRAAEVSALGAEQVARRTDARPPKVEPTRLVTTIVESTRIHPNRLQVRLADGQIWRQIQGDTQIVELARDMPVPAEIWASGSGGYRMRLPEIGRLLKVERLR